MNKDAQINKDWFSIVDKQPNVDERVIGYDEYYERIGEACLAPWDDTILVFIDSDDCYITHWTPMPKFNKEAHV